MARTRQLIVETGLIDALLNFTSVQAAKNDPVLAAHMDQLQNWRGSYVLPDVKSWRVSQDTLNANGDPVHSYRTGWSLIIALPNVASALFNHSNLIVMIDRNKAIARVPGQLLKVNVTQVIMQDTRWEPVFAGCDYPWGSWQV